MDSKLAKSYENSYTDWYIEPIVQFRPNHRRHQAMESVNSGEYSPPLWKNNSPSPPKSPSHPLLDHHHRSLSSDSRAQAIARGQWELMEMVKNMPESSYELSLKDLVENYQEIKRDDGSLENNQDLHQRAAGVVKLKRSQEESNKINYDRNKGLFLNMVFPFSLKSKKKKRNSGKVSLKFDGLKGNGEMGWWKKRFTGSSDSDSSRISNNSGGTTTTTSSSGGSGRERNGLLTGCWPFLCSRRGQSKSVE